MKSGPERLRLSGFGNGTICRGFRDSTGIGEDIKRKKQWKDQCKLLLNVIVLLSTRLKYLFGVIIVIPVGAQNAPISTESPFVLQRISSREGQSEKGKSSEKTVGVV